MDKNTTININNTNRQDVLLLINASIQAYNAFSHHHPSECQTSQVKAPADFEFIECFSGVDAIFNQDKQVEIYGVVFRSLQPPYHYIFSFKGTASIMDMLDDLGIEHDSFVPFNAQQDLSPDIKVEAGFYAVYTDADGAVKSMRDQVFQLVKKYQRSDKPVAQLFITGHSLGAALSTLFSFDIALSCPEIKTTTINFASPRVGNQYFVNYYQNQLMKNGQRRFLRVQNSYDIVPCVPPEDLDYQHISNALIIAFYKDGFIGKVEFADSHSSYNYEAVLNCAVQSMSGICENNALYVTANKYEITSRKPDPDRLCNWPGLEQSASVVML